MSEFDVLSPFWQGVIGSLFGAGILYLLKKSFDLSIEYYRSHSQSSKIKRQFFSDRTKYICKNPDRFHSLVWLDLFFIIRVILIALIHAAFAFLLQGGIGFFSDAISTVFFAFSIFIFIIIMALFFMALNRALFAFHLLSTISAIEIDNNN